MNHPRISVLRAPALFAAASALCLLILAPRPAPAQDSGVWDLDADGNWSTGNWVAVSGTMPPNGAGDEAELGNITTQSRSITLDIGVTLGQLRFTGGSYDDGNYNLLTGGNLTLDQDGVGAGAARISLLNASSPTITGGVLLADDVVFDLQSISSLSVRGVWSGSGDVTVDGLGRNSFGSGTNAEVNTFVGDIHLNGGILAINGGNTAALRDGRLGDTNNDLIFDGGALSIGGDLAFGANRTLSFNPGGGTLDITGGTTTVGTAGQLVGSGQLGKSGAGTLLVSGDNSGFSGDVIVAAGLVDVTAANGLGTVGPGLGSIVLGGVAAQLNAPDVAQPDRSFIVGPNAALQGGSAFLASLNRGATGDDGRLLLRRGAVIGQTTAGSAAMIADLGAGADLLLGIGGNLTVETGSLGAGSAWMGLSSTRSGGTILSGGFVLGGGPIVLQSLRGNLILGNSTASVSLTGNGTTSVTVTTSLAANAAARNLGFVALAGSNPDFSGVSDFRVAPNAGLVVTGVDGLGGKPVIVGPGGALGDFANSATNMPANTFGTSTITLRDGSRLNLRSNLTATVALGGNIVLESVRSAQISADRSGGTSRLEVSNLSIGVNNASVILSSGSSKTFGVSGTIDGGGYDFALSPSSGTHTLNAAWTGNGTFLKGESGGLVLAGDLSAFTGNIAIRAGSLQLPASSASWFGGANGTSTYRIGDSNSVARGARGYGVLLLGADANAGPRLDPASTGVLGLGSDNSLLDGVNGSGAFIAASGGARNLTSNALAAGAGATYRLGGLGQTLTVTNGVLDGANNLIVGGERDWTLGNGTFSNGSGTVVLSAANSFNGTALINPTSALRIEADGGVGGNGTGAGDITAHGNLVIGGGAGGGGTIAAGYAGLLDVRRGGSLTITNANGDQADRVPDSASIRIASTALTYAGRAGADNAETLGNVTLESANTVALNRGDASNNLTLTINALSRAAGATVSFEASSGATLGGTAAGDARLLLPGTPAGFLGGWALVQNSDFAEYDTTNGVRDLGDAGRLALSASAAGGNPISTAADTLGANTTMNSWRISGAPTVDLNNGTLTLSSGGWLHTGATDVTLSNGSITSGAPELFFTGNSANTTVTADISGAIDLTKGGPNSLIFDRPGASMSYNGTTYLNSGALTLRNTTLSGGVRLQGAGSSPGTRAILNLRSNSSPGVPLVNGTVDVISAQAPGGGNNNTISLATINGTKVNGLEFAIGGLTVRDNSRLNLAGPGNSFINNLIVEGDVSFGAGAVVAISGNADGGGVGTTLVVRGGNYSDTTTTVIRNEQNFFQGKYSGGIVFDGGFTYGVNATITNGANQRGMLGAVGNGTVVNYNGYFNMGSITSHLGAWDGARIVIGANATLDNSTGWSGLDYFNGSNNEFAINGYGGGVVSFEPGFVAAREIETADRTDANWGGIVRLNGIMETQHTQNLPNYMGSIRMETSGARWITRTNDQVYDQVVGIDNTSGVIETITQLSLTGPLFLGTGLNLRGDSGRAVVRDWELTGRFDMPEDAANVTPGELIKEGANVLALSGPVVVSNVGRILSRQGAVNLNGTILTTAPEGVLHLDTAGSGTVVQNYNVTVNDANSLTIKTNGATGNVAIQNGKVLQGGGRLLNDVVVDPGGTVQGNLFLQNVTNSGEVSPGDSPGTLFTRNYTQTASGNLNIQINGGPTARTLWDHLVVGGQAVLNGVLNLIFDNPLVTLAGDTWRFLTSAGVTGNFTTVNITAPGNLTASDFVVEYGADYVQVKRNGTAATTYDTWKLTYWPSPDANDDWNDDPDLDGNNNLTEYALDTDPLTADAELLPVTVQESGGNLTLGYTRPGGAANYRSDLVYKVQRTTDLTGTANLNTDTPAGTDPDPTNVSVASPVPYGSVDREFLDLRIEFTAAPAP